MGSSRPPAPILTDMTSFDRERWIERVERSRLMRHRDRDLSAVNHLGVLVEWCRLQGVSVDFRRMMGGEYDPNTRAITCSSGARPEKQVHNILHEAGHHLLETSRTAGSQAPEARKGSIAHGVNRLNEEFEAWNMGARLAGWLGIPLDETWERYRVECLAAYILWASSRGRGYEDDD